MKKMTRIAALITFAGLLCACNTVPPAGGVFTKMPHYSNIFAKAKPSTRLNAMLSSPGIMKLWLRI